MPSVAVLSSLCPTKAAAAFVAAQRALEDNTPETWKWVVESQAHQDLVAALDGTSEAPSPLTAACSDLVTAFRAAQDSAQAVAALAGTPPPTCEELRAVAVMGGMRAATLASLGDAGEGVELVDTASTIIDGPEIASLGWVVVVGDLGCLSLRAQYRLACAGAQVIHVPEADAEGVAVAFARPHTPWWMAAEKQAALMDVASAQDTPVYVYDLETLETRAAELVGMVEAGPLARVWYAVKANCCPEVLSALESRGVGFECVSLGEMAMIEAQFPDLDVAARVLFTPNFAHPSEYAVALEKGCVVTVDNASLITARPDVFAGHEVMLRVDPGVGKGHHVHVQTAGKVSKFGIPVDDLPSLAAFAAAHNIRIVGLHAHTGSGIDDADTWGNNARLLAGLGGLFPELRVVDVGGGLCVPYRPWEGRQDMAKVRQYLDEVHELFPQYDLWMEPGRYWVAEAGVLVTHVTQCKDKGEGARYIGVDAGFSALLRPILYAAYHEIAVLSRLAEVPACVATVVGPICESGDILGRARVLPAATAPGDVVVVGVAGAYGHTMASEYNRRPIPAQVLLSGPAPSS